MIALLQAAAWSGAATLALLLLSRVWRRDEGALWHAVWVAVALASMALPMLNALVPDFFTLTISAAVANSGLSTAATAWVARTNAAAFLFYAYLAGVAWSAFRLISGVLLVGRLCRHSEAVEGILLARIRQCAAVPPGMVRTHRRVQVPFTAGFVRPVVLLPATWMMWDTDRLTVVLCHELAHVARADYRWNLFALAFEAMFWFSPLARIVSKRIRLSAELASDFSASGQMDRTSYARILVESARELMAERRRGLVAPGAATSLKARIAALTSRPDSSSPISARARLAAVAIVLVALLASAFVRAQSAPTRFSADHRTQHQATHGATHR